MRRQDAPNVYNMTTVTYVAKKNYIKECRDMWTGKCKMVEVKEETAIDIDTILEFNITKVLIQSSDEGERCITGGGGRQECNRKDA